MFARVTGQAGSLALLLLCYRKPGSVPSAFRLRCCALLLSAFGRMPGGRLVVSRARDGGGGPAGTPAPAPSRCSVTARRL
eukprot:359491-Chlamydomonas_euryale.AAC.8